MTNILHKVRRSTGRVGEVWGIVVFGLLAVFWATIELSSYNSYLGPISAVRAVVGVLLLLFVPGALLTRLLSVSADRFGQFTLFSVCLSFVILIGVNLFANFVLPVLGIEEPLTVLFLASLVSAVIVGLLFLTYSTDRTVDVPRVRLAGPLPVILLLLLLPSLSVAAVITMEQFDTSLGMGLAVATIIAVVLLASTRYLPPTLYSTAVFSVSISTLFHRNLFTDHVLGADIQASYFISRLLLDVHYLSPEVGESMTAIPTVTSVPATFTMLTGLEIATVFKVIYVFAFSLVPIGVFYVSRLLFDDHIAFFASLSVIFYHGSFYFTPGKQLISELFLVPLLLVFVRDGADGTSQKLVLLALSAGLIFTHYGVTYVFGLSLLGASVMLTLARRVSDNVDHDLSLWYPVVFLVVATASYLYIAPELVVRIALILPNVVDQLVAIVVRGTIAGSGASYVQSETDLLATLNVALYFALTILISIGLFLDVLSHLASIRYGRETDRIEYVALAIPLFVFLGSSYFVIANLYADRVYQMVLPILSPYIALGYISLVGQTTALLDRIDAFRESVGKHVRTGSHRWILLAVLLGGVLAFNSGAVFALAGTAKTSTFNPNANDLTFGAGEREAAVWLEANVPAIEKYGRGQYRPTESGGSGSTVRIYTDSRGFQLLRAFVLPSYTNVELIPLRNRWRPVLHPSWVKDGYLFVRAESVSQRPEESLPVSLLPRTKIDDIYTTRNVIYSSDAVRIAYSPNNSSV